MSAAFDKIRSGEEHLLCRSYSRYPLAIVRGEGTKLWDIDGREYTDLLSGIGVIALGHCNPEVCEALDRQSRLLWHISNLFYQEPQLELAEALIATYPGTKAFFCNSGAEANEACIKLARRYMRKVAKRDAYEIISLQGCFHGRTYGALAATGRESLTDGFGPMPSGFIQVPPGNMEAMKSAISARTAAVIVECIQGEGGVVPLDPAYLQAVEELCHSKGILLICDEVQCGLCRPGKFWGFQTAGLHPDAISIAKGLANGLPMGAMLATTEMAKGFEPGSHATTFGGGALTSAVAKKVIEIMQRDKLAERAERVGRAFREELHALQQKYPRKIREIRGPGLMIGIELSFEGRQVWLDLIEAGFICNLSHGRTLRLLPPLIITSEELHNFAQALDRILDRVPERCSVNEG